MRIWLGGAKTFGGASATPAPTSGSGGRRRLAAASSSSCRTSAHRHRTAAAAMAEEVNGPRMQVMGGVHDAPAGRENDLEAIELARFAVAEHNSKTNAMLEFERLVKVRHQVVAGTMHHFTVEVNEAGGSKKLYEAKVWEKVWENFKQLQSFQPVGDAAVA